jgi:hypothetical protein
MAGRTTRATIVVVKGTKPSIGQIFIGPHAVHYVATDTDDPNGYVTRVTAVRRRRSGLG